MAVFRSGVVAGVFVMLSVILVAPTEASTFELDMREYDGSNLICSTVPEASQISTQPITCRRSAQRTGATGNGSVTMETTAGPGWVRSLLESNVSNANGFNFGYGGCSDVRILIDDIVVSGPAEPATAEITVDISGDATFDPPRAAEPVRFKVILRSRTSGGAIRDTATDTFDVTASGMIDTTFSPGAVSIEAGDTLEVELSIQLRFGLHVDNGTPTKSASADFAEVPSMYGMSFPRTGPVFDLPAGFTVNSVEGNIEDNLWTPPIFFDGFEFGDTAVWSITTQ